MDSRYANHRMSIGVAQSRKFQSSSSIVSESPEASFTSQQILNPPFASRTTRSVLAPARSRLISLSPNVTIRLSRTTKATDPTTFMGLVLTKPVTRTLGSLCRIWLRNNAVRSLPEECIFVLHVRAQGFKAAIDLATKFHWQYQQPLQELLAMMSEPGKNYSEQSAKRRRPSGSSASLKKAFVNRVNRRRVLRFSSQ